MVSKNKGVHHANVQNEERTLSMFHYKKRGEVCHLELTDIDFSNNMIKIQKKSHLNWNPKKRNLD